MSEKKSQLQAGLKKATIEMLLLKLLSESDMYGYQLSQELKKRSQGIYTILEGSMYPILYRLSDQDFISYHEEKIGRRQTRVYYHIESTGKEHLKNLIDNYFQYTNIIEFLLSSSEGDTYEQ